MTLLPARQTLSIWLGTTFRKSITVLTGAVGSAPVDLTGYSATMEIFSHTGTVLYTLSTTNSQITLGGGAGTIALYIPNTDTATFSGWGGAVYELTITDTGGNGDEEALLWGPLRLLGPS